MTRGNTRITQDAATQAPVAPDETSVKFEEVAQNRKEPARDNDPMSATLDEPVRLRLAAPYGFIDEDTDAHHYWQAGQEVTDPAQIKLLLERQAPLE